MFLKILSEIKSKRNAAYKNNKNENSSSTAQLATKGKKRQNIRLCDENLKKRLSKKKILRCIYLNSRKHLRNSAFFRYNSDFKRQKNAH